MLTATGGPDVNVDRQGQLPRRARGPSRRPPRRAQRDQRGRHRGLRPRGDREGVAGLLAARGAARPGGRRPLLRAQHLQARRRLRSLRRHPQPGLRRGGGGDREDEPGGGRHRAPGRPLQRQDRPDLLLLHLGRLHREQRVLRRSASAAPRSPTCAGSPTPTTTSRPTTAGRGSSPRPRSSRGSATWSGARSRTSSSPRPASRRGSSRRRWWAPAAPGTSPAPTCGRTSACPTPGPPSGGWRRGASPAENPRTLATGA